MRHGVDGAAAERRRRVELELCSLLPEVEDECAKARPPASESDEGLVRLDQCGPMRCQVRTVRLRFDGPDRARRSDGPNGQTDLDDPIEI